MDRAAVFVDAGYLFAEGSRLLAGDMLGDATSAAMRAAARNVDHRGATGLASYLRGELTLT